MEDMTAPDTMINFSELPQQPNYYQCPQTAQDNLALGFNMSLHQSSHPSFSQPQPFTPHQYSMSNVSLSGQLLSYWQRAAGA
ncbi:hypothetical protein EB796_020720 [Bugula neritina]|uniref:Uncharacterized protein n=1 Tax=Bugula neritina TaxID=10212 RepID=A0A7J7J4W2_BUGNE|nr:hypothetical protein EB796_020720 [Bugula neritina]